ncbi:hypothetical protein TNCV_329441 [Trichonephila clavipes]|nr:hypothetical protein TNCV_329441 [Trichonephila clavipes]
MFTESQVFRYSKASGDGLRNFEPWSSDEDDTPSPNIHTIPTGGRLRYRQISLASFPYTGVFSGTWLELMTDRPRVCYLDH